jgi:hypothetical protein
MPKLTTKGNNNKEERKGQAKRGPYGKKYSKAELLKAVCAVQHGQLSQHAAAVAFHVPRASLQDYLRRHSALPSEKTEDVAAAGVASLLSLSASSSPATIISPPSSLPPLVSVLCVIDPHGCVAVSVEAARESRVGENISVHSNIQPFLLAPHSGPPTLLTHEEESAFAHWLIRCSDLHLPVPKCIANEKARAILERRGAKFSTETGVPGRHWWDGFYRRWPAVAPRKPQPITKGKALLTKEHVDAFFNDLQTLSSIPPQVSKGATWVRVACAKTG